MRFLGLVAVAFALLPTATAGATDYCVLPETSCSPGNRFATIQSALDAATSPGADRVLIPAGTFAVPSGGLSYFGDQVEVVGAGQGTTVLNGPTTPSFEVVLGITHGGGGRSVVRGLTVNVGPVDAISATPNFGVKVRGGVDLRDLLVHADGRAVGVDLDSASTLSSSRVALPLELSSLTRGVVATTGTTGAAIIRDSTIEANLAVGNGGGTEIRLERTAIKASIFGVWGGRGFVFADNVLVEMADFASAGAWAFGTRGDSVAGSSYIEVRNSTAVGGNAGTIGVLAESGNGTPATAVVTNSIIRTPGVSLKRRYEISSGAAADITANHNAFHPAAVIDDDSGHGSIVNIAPRTDDPLFLGGSGPGRYRLRHDSPLIDAGNPGSAPIPPNDFNGDPRIVDGNGDGNAVRDLGAYEYQRKAPAVTAAAAPASVFPGDPIAWTASGTDPDGDPITFAWSWDDGATGSGASVTHAFTPLGAHTGTVTATDATGLTATGGASATVGARPLTPGGGDGGGGGGASDRLAPRFTIARHPLSLTRRNVVAVRITCDAAETEPCAGTLTLASAKKLVRKKRVLQLGRKAFSIAPGKSASVKIKLSKRTARTARGLRRFKVTAVAVARDRAGNKATKRYSSTLTAARSSR